MSILKDYIIQYIISVLYCTMETKSQLKQEREFIIHQKRFIQALTAKELREQDLGRQLQKVISKIKKYTFSYIYFLSVHGFFKAMFGQPKQNEKVKSHLGTIVSLAKQIYERIIVIQAPQVQQSIQNYKVSNSEKITIPQQQKNLMAAHEDILAAINSKEKNNLFHKALDSVFQYETKPQQKSDVNALRQFSINYMKIQIDNIRLKHYQSYQNKICCKALFCLQENIDSPQGPSQQFKRYVWPIKNLNIEVHIAKTIAGFMNSKGGVIYIGIMENKEKRNELVGIELTQRTAKQLKEFMSDKILKSIYPQHLGFDEQFAKGVKNVPQYKHILNDYVQMEFLPVADRETLTNIRYITSNNQVVDLLVVKIIVKIGHPKHLYHLVNNQKNIDFYERLDRNVEKKPFPQAYKQIYERLERFEKYRKNLKDLMLMRQQFHPNCKYRMDIKHIALKEDEEHQNSDDDY